MKKNRMMRLASILLVCVLLTTSVISGTFAKYTTSANSEDKARVAKWGFDNAASIDITDLFANTYKQVSTASTTYYKKQVAGVFYFIASKARAFWVLYSWE